MSTFTGDGKYVADGGAYLQKLWESHKWKEIKNCPGRYVSPRNKRLSTLTPTEVLDSLVDFVNWTPKSLKTVVGRVGSRLIFRGAHIAANAERDSCWFFTFCDGGGLITYEKADGIFVHTLNTQSGLMRKVNAVAPIELSAALQLGAVEKMVLHILSFLDDTSQNAGAYPLVLTTRKFLNYLC